MVPQGYKFFWVQTVEMGYCTPKWGTVGNPDYEHLFTINEFDRLLLLVPEVYFPVTINIWVIAIIKKQPYVHTRLRICGCAWDFRKFRIYMTRNLLINKEKCSKSEFYSYQIRRDFFGQCSTNTLPSNKSNAHIWKPKHLEFFLINFIH